MKTPKPIQPRSLFAAALAALFTWCTAPSAHAANIYWDGGTANWSTVSAWSANSVNATPDPASAPGSSDDIFFNRTGNNAAGNTVSFANGSRAGRSLTFNTSGTSNLRGGAADTVNVNLTIGTGGITLASTAGAVTISQTPSAYGTITTILGGSQTWTNNSANALTVVGPVTLGANTLTLSGDGSGGISISGAIGGSGAVIVNRAGSGGVTLSGANAYGGATTITAGILVANHANALGTTAGFTSIAGGAANSQLQLGSLNYAAEPITLNGRNANTQDAHILNSTGNSTGFGNISLSTGGSYYLIESASGKLTLGGNIIRGNATGNRYIYLQGAGNGEISGQIDPATEINMFVYKRGAGTWTLSGANGYSGPTTVSEGTLLVNNSTGSGSGSGSVTVDAGTLGGNGTIGGAVTVAASATLAPGATVGTLTLNNNLTLNASALVKLDLSSTYNGANDKLVLAGTGAVLTPNGAQITLNSAGTLDTSGNDYVLIDLTGSGASISGSFNSTPAWAGTTPANSGNYSIVTSGTQVKLQYVGSTSPTAVGLATPASLSHDQTTLLTVTVTPGANPASTGLAVTADLSSIGGSATQTFHDDGSNGDVSAGDNVFSYTYTIPGGTSLGAKSLSASISDAESRSTTANIALTVVTANLTWSATPADADWGTGGNWTTGFSPAAGDFVYFDTTTEYAPNLETAYSVNSVTFNSGAGSYTIGGSTLTLTGSGVTNNSTSAQTLNMPVDMGASQTLDAASGDVTLGGTVSGSGKSLTKAGAGTVTLSGLSATPANNYSGTTTIGEGTLAITTTSPALSGGLTFGASATSPNVGTLDLSAASATFGNLTVQTTNAAVTNVITIGSGQSLTNTASAAVNVVSVGSAVTANLQVTGANGTLTVNDATRNIVVATTINTTAAGNQTLDLSALGTFDATIANLFVGRPTTSAGAATTGKVSGDAMILAATNTITASGAIVVGDTATSGNGSTLTASMTLGTTNALNAASIVVGASRISSTMQFNTGLTAPSVTLRGASGGTSRADIYLGDGADTLGYGTGSGGSTTSLGTMNLSAGTVDAMIGSLYVGYGANDNNSGTSPAYGAGNGVFTFGGSTSVVDIDTLVIGETKNNSFNAPNKTTSTGTFTMNDGSLTINTAMTIANDLDQNTGTCVQSVVGTFNLAGGSATITPGITLGNHSSSGTGLATATLNLTGGTLNMFGDIKEGTLGSGTVTSSLSLNGATLDMNGNNITSLDSINYTDGTLKNLGVVNTGLTLAGTGARVFEQGSSISGEIQGIVDGSGVGLDKTGDGTLTLSGNNSYTGDTIVSAGTLALSGGGSIATSPNIIVGTAPVSPAILDVTAAGLTLGAAQTLKGHGTVNGLVTVNSGGTLAPGASIGTLTFGTAPTLNGTLLMEIDRNGGSPLADQILGLGGLGGTLIVNNIGATLVNGDTFTLFNTGNTGSFATTTLPHGNAHWNLSALNSAGTITFVNTAPVAKNLTNGVSQGNSATLLIIGGKNGPTDAEGDALTVTGVTQPSEGGVTFTSSSVTYDATGAAGTHTYSYTVSDPFGATDTKTVTVVVTPFSSTGANIVPGSFSLTGGNNVQLQAFGIPGATYRLEYTDDLNAPIVWADLPSSDVAAGTNGAISFNYTHSESLPGSGFFRTKYISGP